MTRLFIGLSVSLTVVTAGIALIGSFSFDVIWVAFLVAFPVIGIWAWRCYSIGSVELGDRELIVVSRAHTQRYQWSDIESVTACTLGEVKSGLDEWLLRAMGLDMSRRIALVLLNRVNRLSPIWERSGTRTGGIPLGKRVHIETENVQGFVEAANTVLRSERS
jgi:hypothetical protein